MIMNVSLRLQTIARRPVWSSNVVRRTAPWRRFFSAMPTDDTLPLKGVRVLDMTRVLAGVCTAWGSLCVARDADPVPPAILYADPR